MKDQVSLAEAKSGMKQIHEFMMERILAIDKVTGMKILTVWTLFISHGAGPGKNIQFESSDAFVNYGLVDVAGEWVDYVMRFGMSLTEEEERCSAPPFRLAYLIAALHNDYVSFDVGYSICKDDHEAESLQAFTIASRVVSEEPSCFMNLVMMYLNEMGVNEAKRSTKLKTRAYEDEVHCPWPDLTRKEHATDNVVKYMRLGIGPNIDLL
ncbi:geranylgeranyl pyrophosphate synthase [Colletotrichum sp. SAR11_240]|nr:geranylgeranyl pyrophosphate synthase [Colletotrichum sp. SAR11_240]